MHSLSGHPEIDSRDHESLIRDYERFRTGLPQDVEDYVRQQYRVDLSSEYGEHPIKNPFGKASGQLSLNLSQMRRDCEEQLGYIVLKSIIAEDAFGSQSMSDWVIEETSTVVERIVGNDNTPGWTVSWKGRGWHETFAKYLEFFDEALALARGASVLVVPSAKSRVPGAAEGGWKTGEYEYTARCLIDVWQRHHPDAPMLIEKDFSPTLAGDDRAAQAEMIIEWLTHVTSLIRQGAAPAPIRIGLKVFNAILDDAFQLEMLRAINEECSGDGIPDFLVYANRLFDPEREFDGVRGIAYGGPDLSARNLNVLAHLRALERQEAIPFCSLPISATGNIVSGRIAAEYLLRGASSFQIHTFFQLPSGEYAMKTGGKTARALHELYFHPEEGLLAWLLHLRRLFDWPVEWNVKQMAEFCMAPANNVWAEHAPVLS